MTELESVCKDIRENILSLSFRAKSAHAGSALSCTEILGSIFWLRYREGFPISKFVLSKGHAAMALYSTALKFGLLEPTVLETYLQDGSALWGHPSVSEKFEFIHWSTGSLGHGLPACVGFAYAEKYLKSDKTAPGIVVAVVSDGELNEGTCWEALLFASHHKLDNLVVIVDFNQIQSFGRCDDIMKLEPLVPKFEAFGFRTKKIDGHSPQDIITAIKTAGDHSGMPTCLVADTVKGKGVAGIEDTLASHYKPITAEQLETFRK